LALLQLGDIASGCAFYQPEEASNWRASQWAASFWPEQKSEDIPQTEP